MHADHNPADGSPSKTALHARLYGELSAVLDFHEPGDGTEAMTDPVSDLISDVLAVCAKFDEHRKTRVYGDADV